MAVRYEQVVAEDLNLGLDPVTVTMPAGGTATGSKIGIHTFWRNVVNLRDAGAIGDGVTYDDAAWAKAYANLSPTGGTILGEPGHSYRLNATFTVDRSNVTVDLQGSEVLFQPTDPATNDRVLLVHAGDGTGYSSKRPIASAIARGATTFTASSAPDTGDLVANDWLMIIETDPGLGDICIIDWVQVQGVVGAVVTTLNPFRTAFPGTHSTTTFQRITNLVENTLFQNMRIRTTDTVNALVGVAFGVAKGITVDNVVSAPIKGNAFFSYRTMDLTIAHCRQTLNKGQATEFAATVDLGLYGNTFSTADASADTSAVTIDMGTGPFVMVGNKLVNAGNICMQLVSGCHDGTIVGNSFGFVNDTGITNCIGLVSLGSQNVTVVANSFMGGDGASGYAIGFGDTSSLTVNIASQGNVIGLNAIRGFTTQYGSVSAADVYVNANIGANGAMGIPNPITLGLAVGSPEKQLNFRSATFLPAVIHWEKIGTSNWYAGPDETQWFVGFNADSDRALAVSQAGVLTAKAGVKASAASSSINAVFTGSKTVAPTAYSSNPIAANSVATFTMTVTGARGGDAVTVSPDQLLSANLGWSAYVSANDTVTVQVINPTGSPVTPTNTVTWWAVAMRAF